MKSGSKKDSAVIACFAEMYLFSKVSHKTENNWNVENLSQLPCWTCKMVFRPEPQIKQTKDSAKVLHNAWIHENGKKITGKIIDSDPNDCNVVSSKVNTKTWEQWKCWIHRFVWTVSSCPLRGARRGRTAHREAQKI